MITGRPCGQKYGCSVAKSLSTRNLRSCDDNLSPALIDALHAYVDVIYSIKEELISLECEYFSTISFITLISLPTSISEGIPSTIIVSLPNSLISKPILLKYGRGVEFFRLSSNNL